ncbi:NADH:flavin oxidoreductase/NADH oxidase family protein [Talaromyces stipitatus ATCC 10500]|uniref:NADH:flavin oxidoreductase/NADH oxidase family protein n=1 Tax=Talaromyces stipitatus (strain ATCC 10500 / CBS 375.48 / QM 6759 / NRRL 1006) TaxID=441959 RepID=B8MGW6_TALSN|nr:NADH:flavin oxidoreductase/NADH oxidase family protein [Talaromyces stipitatus ATCC 10500]EED16347.1 NADH:flavin oxidoreductase/NADH oxidase family protein [Talaromyces stipitatus ATCC 10500]
MPTLFTPLQVGRLQLSHRIALAPLSRYRVEDNTHTPIVSLVKEYYTQRASTPGTLLISEATLITPQAGAYTNAPGIWSEAQIKAWKEIVDAIHAKGSYIYLQLWALGRAADPVALRAQPGGEKFEVVSSSSTLLVNEERVHDTPRALTEEEIQQYIRDYATAAKNAVERAGFDGVEIHGANGYLIDQFIQNIVNHRTDRWGGSAENRARFALEIVKAVSEAVGADRTAIRFSPYSTYNDMNMTDSDRDETFTYLAQEVAKFKLAYVHLVESRVSGNADVEQPQGSLQFFLDAYRDASPLVLAGGYKAHSAKEAVETRYKDHQVVIAFGRPFISNPDLPFRIKEGIELAPYNRDTFYLFKDPKGYVDYPFSERLACIVEYI